MIKINFLIQTEKLKNDLAKEFSSFLSDHSIQYCVCDQLSEVQSDDNIIHFIELLTNEQIDLAKIMLKLFHNSSIIFISNRNELVFGALSVHPLQFIRLSDFDNDLTNTKKAILNYIEKNVIVLTFKLKTSIIRLNIKTISYIESYGHYLLIHCVNDEFKVRDKISSVMERLNNRVFIRVHKSYLVNPNFINDIYHNRVVLIDNYEIPIGRSYRDNFIEKYQWFEKEGRI